MAIIATRERDCWRKIIFLRMIIFFIARDVSGSPCHSVLMANPEQTKRLPTLTNRTRLFVSSNSCSLVVYFIYVRLLFIDNPIA